MIQLNYNKESVTWLLAIVCGIDLHHTQQLFVKENKCVVSPPSEIGEILHLCTICFIIYNHIVNVPSILRALRLNLVIIVQFILVK